MSASRSSDIKITASSRRFSKRWDGVKCLYNVFSGVKTEKQFGIPKTSALEPNFESTMRKISPSDCSKLAQCGSFSK